MNIHEFECKIIKGHIFAKIGGALVLCDSGSPLSFGAIENLQIGERIFDLRNDYFGFEISEVSRLIGVETTALIGGDILNHFACYSIALASEKISFFESPVEKAGEVLPAKFVMGVPSIPVNLGHKITHMFLDSAAKLSFLTEESLKGCPYAGPETDFYLGYGPFKTETFKKIVTVAGKDVEITFGVLPEILEKTLLMTTGASGIIGSFIFKEAKVCLSKRDASVTFDW